MTKAQAMAKAETESRNGYVQHVNIDSRWNGTTWKPVTSVDGSSAYTVSDWYGASTVASFENGKRK